MKLNTQTYISRYVYFCKCIYIISSSTTAVIITYNETIILLTGRIYRKGIIKCSSSILVIKSKLNCWCFAPLHNSVILFHKSQSEVILGTFDLNSLSANPIKWSNTRKQFVNKLPTNCLSLFNHFMKLALKGLIGLSMNGSPAFYHLSSV